MTRAQKISAGLRKYFARKRKLARTVALSKARHAKRVALRGVQ